MKKLAVLAVLLLVSACGVKPTPVVAAGPAPTLRSPATAGRGTDLILYFVLADRVAPVVRPSAGVVGVESALTMLLDGPSVDEREGGYTTALPGPSGTIALTPGSPATITVPFPLRPLTGVGISQLVCTAFAALAAQGRYAVDGTIDLAGPDVRLPYQTCQA
ncbi:hypothetical protein [Amycolatopsis tolypomycina]|uniref:Sporulation and spore germination n=1 Tax=Amycolatopsis tolypomycina TaxID=208445 RepID=A0A1H4SHB2_9PSEU|nr:hypothetical protein [Amycolatopsis tolypomycina]SEC43612.1 hypothetical protein SAMN04489727_3743 [Amycolatopsis tolypomycina]